MFRNICQICVSEHLEQVLVHSLSWSIKSLNRLSLLYEIVFVKLTMRRRSENNNPDLNVSWGKISAVSWIHSTCKLRVCSVFTQEKGQNKELKNPPNSHCRRWRFLLLSHNASDKGAAHIWGWTPGTRQKTTRRHSSWVCILIKTLNMFQTSCLSVQWPAETCFLCCLIILHILYIFYMSGVYDCCVKLKDQTEIRWCFAASSLLPPATCTAVALRSAVLRD